MLSKDGIDILNLVVPKPEIPADIAANYKQVLPFLSYHDDMGGEDGFVVM